MLNQVSSRAGWLFAAALLAQGGLQAAAAQEPPIKIAVVDLDRLVLLSAPGQALQGRLEQFQKEFQAEGERMTKAAEDIRKKAADGRGSLSEDALADLQKQYEDQTIAIRRFRDDKQREAEKMRNDGLQEIERQLNPVFKAIRDEEGYDLILNNTAGVVVMASPRVDITDHLLEKLKAMQASGSGG